MAPNPKPLLKVGDIHKRFGRTWVLKGIAFEVHAGECLIVTGRNGSGKSTLLRILSGLERPTKGEIEVDPSLSFCALDQAMFADLTVLEHLRLASDLQGIPDRAEEMAEKCGLSSHRNHESKDLSSGLRSRLRIAVAIQSDPKVLIWDEPGVALDEAGRELIEQIVEEQKQRGALILATNDPSERRFGTHVLEL